MSLSLSRRAASIAQAEIRAMSLACEKVGGINLAQGWCDTEVPLAVRRAAQRAMDLGVNSHDLFVFPDEMYEYFLYEIYVCAPAPLQYGAAAGIRDLPPGFYLCFAKPEHEIEEACRRFETAS